MSLTVDNYNNIILLKLGYLSEIVNIYNTCEFDGISPRVILDVKKNIYDTKYDYESGSINILAQYYSSQDVSQRSIIYRKYINFLNQDNVVGKINHAHIFCKRIYNSYDLDEEEDIKLLLAKFNYHALDAGALACEADVRERCSCGGSFVKQSNTSETLCHICGRTEKMPGVVMLDDTYFYLNQENNRNKHSGYDPTKHCKFWVDRILARENTEIPEKLITRIKECIRRDNIYKNRLTCDIIREYLKDLKYSKYNNHVPLIKKIITNVEPPQLTDYEMKILFAKFSKVIQIYNKIKPDNMQNCKYHPFFIYKILEQIINRAEDAYRKSELLASIHTQSSETLIVNDTIWQSICEVLPEFKYVPTQPR